MKRNHFLTLTQGELTRLNKYGVTTISFVVAIVWGLMLYFVKDAGIFSKLLPLIIVFDATMMSIIFIGAVMFFEKTESTFSTMLVTPVSRQNLILSKATANTIQLIFSSMLIILVFYFIKDVQIRWVLVIFGLLVSIFFHSLLGFIFSFHSKDFTSMLMGVITYVFLFSVPSILNAFDVIFKGEVWSYVLLIFPTQAAIQLINVGFGAAITLKFYLSIVVFLVIGICGYAFYILPKFKEYAVKQSGV